MTKDINNSSPQMSRDPIVFVRNFFNVSKVKRAFRLGSDIFNAMQPFIEKQTSLNAVKSAFMVGKVIVDDFEIWPEDFFDVNWEAPYPSEFNKLILDALSGKSYSVSKTSDESVVVHIVQVNDVKFGYVINTKTKYVDKIYVEVDKIDKAKEIVKKELWKTLKDDNIVLRHIKRPPSNNSYDTPVSLEPDDAFRPMPSRRADEYSNHLKKCIDAGITRSVMLCGPPGTGKSTMARTIVSNLAMKSLRLRVEDMGHIDPVTVYEAINIFEPDAIILDDFDRLETQISLLETLEFFQRHVKLVIATVNNRNRLDNALLRPGRFDELVQIKQMDEDVVRSVLGEDHLSSFDIVKDWPVAFIQEYVKRRRFMTPEEAEISIKELALRVKKITQGLDDDIEEIDRVAGEDVMPSREKFEDDPLDQTFEICLGNVKANKAYGKRRRKL